MPIDLLNQQEAKEKIKIIRRIINQAAGIYDLRDRVEILRPLLPSIYQIAIRAAGSSRGRFDFSDVHFTAEDEDSAYAAIIEKLGDFRKIRIPKSQNFRQRRSDWSVTTELVPWMSRTAQNKLKPIARRQWRERKREIKTSAEELLYSQQASVEAEGTQRLEREEERERILGELAKRSRSDQFFIVLLTEDKTETESIEDAFENILFYMPEFGTGIKGKKAIKAKIKQLNEEIDGLGQYLVETIIYSPFSSLMLGMSVKHKNPADYFLRGRTRTFLR